MDTFAKASALHAAAQQLVDSAAPFSDAQRQSVAIRNSLLGASNARLAALFDLIQAAGG
jgi:hypothetical protein